MNDQQIPMDFEVRTTCMDRKGTDKCKVNQSSFVIRIAVCFDLCTCSYLITIIKVHKQKGDEKSFTLSLTLVYIESTKKVKEMGNRHTKASIRLAPKSFFSWGFE